MSDVPAAERAYLALKQDILAGSVRGGELLSEVEVGSPLGMSRTPVHEAFLRLQAEGLLRLLPRRGAVVVPVEPGEAADILEVRQALETAAVRRLASSDTARTDLAPVLDSLLAQQKQLAAAGDVTGFAEADERFHSAIVRASGNELSIRFYATLSDRQRRMASSSIGSRIDQLAKLVREHGRLAKLIAQSDAAGFDQALDAHLRSTHAALLGGR